MVAYGLAELTANRMTRVTVQGRDTIKHKVSEEQPVRLAALHQHWCTGAGIKAELGGGERVLGCVLDLDVGCRL